MASHRFAAAPDASVRNARPQAWASGASALAMLTAALAANPASAQQTTPGSAQCPVVDGEATCTGAVPGGIRVVDGDNVSRLTVRDLTAPITPPSGVSGIDFRRAIGPVTIRTSAGVNGITTTGAADGIRAEAGGDLTIANALTINARDANASLSNRPGTSAIRAVLLAGTESRTVDIRNDGDLLASVASTSGDTTLSGGIVVDARRSADVRIVNAGAITARNSGNSFVLMDAIGVWANATGAAATYAVNIQNDGALTLQGNNTAGLRVETSRSTNNDRDGLSNLLIVNTGNISGSGDRGIDIGAFNTTGGTYRISNRGAIDLINTRSAGRVGISADLRAQGSDRIIIENFGTVSITSSTSNSATGILIGEGGVVRGGGAAGYDLTNAGRITLQTNGGQVRGIRTTATNITNSGAIHLQGILGSAIEIENIGDADENNIDELGLRDAFLRNSGAITIDTGDDARSVGRGLTLVNVGPSELTNSGSISLRGAEGVGITYLSLTRGTGSNRSDISVNGLDGVGMILSEISETRIGGGSALQFDPSLDLQGSLDFVHAGRIDARGVNGIGVHISSGVFELFGDACGSVFYTCSADDAFRQAYQGRVSLTIESGTITGGSGNGAGVSMTGIGTHILDNSGTISALSGRAVVGGEGRDTVINRGTIDGTVSLGAGDDAFVLYSTGNLPAVDGGAGTDSFALASNAGETFSFDMGRASSLTGFELFGVRGSGIVRLTGSAPASLPRAIAVEGGTLLADTDLSAFTADVRSGATLGGSGQLGATTIADGGVLSPGGDAVGTLALASLVLSSGSILRFDLGRPDVVGGADNDLVTVLGDLTLDGTLNVVQRADYGQGVYRLFNYGGTLTDNGLDLGSGTGQSQVQTVIGGQVNLVVGDALQFWDGGDTAPDLNVDGGSGTWNNGTTNWTRRNGDVNEAWGSGFAVFQGAPGTVTIAPEGVSAAGLQFAVNGYTITGGTLTLTAPATLRVGDGSAGGAGYSATIASGIAGSGGLDKTDLGMLILSGTNSYTGGTTVSGGVLQVVGDANLGAASGGVTLNGGTLRFSSAASSARGYTAGAMGGTLDHANALTLSGAIGGAGTMGKTGVGLLTLTGDSAAFAGTLAVNAGSVRLDGMLGGTVSVASGARLGGTGTLRNATIAGTLAPGNGVGTLTASGDITFTAGSTFEIEVDPSGGSDRLNVAGTATLTGGRVSALFLGNQTAACGTSITSTILTAQGGVNGTFAGVGTNYAFLTPSLSYDANNVRLTLTRNAATFADQGVTANQRASATGAEALGCGNAVYDAIVPLDVAGARNAFDQLSGEAHPSARGALMDDSRFFRDTMLATNERRGVWGSVHGAWGESDGDGNAARVRRGTSGLFAGVDMPLGDAVSVGVGGGYSRADYQVDALVSSAEVQSWHLGARVGVQAGGLNLAVGGALAWHRFDVERVIAFPGFTDATAARYDGETVQAFARAGYEIVLGRSAAVEPFAEVAWVQVRTDAFAESGGPAALSAEAGSNDAWFTTLGARGSAQIGRFTLAGRLGWRRAYDYDPASTRLSFGSGDAFTVTGAPIAVDALIVDAGIGFVLGRGARVSVGYTGQIGDRSRDHGARAMIRLPF